MSLCGVSQLFSTDQNECPAECPYWAPSSAWKYIGVCSNEENCKLFNPILNYADKYNNVCLPCNVFGCISCKYSNLHDSMLPVTDSFKKLPDYCIECATGYTRSEDGKMCYLVNSNIWSKSLAYICIFTLLSIAIVTLRVLVDRDKFKINFKNLVSALKNQQKQLLRDPNDSEGRLYNLKIDMTKSNISGIGMMLYFRSLIFLGLVISLLFFASLAHVHIPCSNMIRVFKEPFRIYYFMRSNDVPRRFITNFFTKNVDKLVDDIFHFKSVDEAIQWNVVQYSNEVSGVMYVLYVSVMFMTVVYLVSQKRIIKSFTSKSSKIKDLTLVIRNLPKSVTTEGQVKEIVYKSTQVMPVSVSICYDIKKRKHSLENLFKSIEELKEQDDTYLNLSSLEEFHSSFDDFESSGECFLTFETVGDCNNALNNFKSRKFELSKCDVEPENVIWENIGYEHKINRKIFGISFLTIAFVLAYSIVFFVPYAFYSITSPMSHILEMLLVSIFVECGNILVSLVLKKLIERASIINKEIVDGYLMFCNYFIKLLNLLFNITLSHLINYGGRNKVLSFLHSKPHADSPSFKVGEEISFGLSFSIYMFNVLILIPNALFILVYYVLPIFNSFLVLTMDFDLKTASALLQYSDFDLSNNYSDDMSKITCSLFLLFIIKDQKQAIIVFFSLFLSYCLNYLKSQFILLRRSSKKFYSTWKLSYFTNVMWIFPTLILSICPRYWDWRSGEGGFFSIITTGFFHTVIYSLLLYSIFSVSNKDDQEFSLSEILDDKSYNGFDLDLDYKTNNPVYKLKTMAMEFNIL